MENVSRWAGARFVMPRSFDDMSIVSGYINGIQLGRSGTTLRLGVLRVEFQLLQLNGAFG